MRTAALCLLLAAALPAWAQQGLNDVEMLKKYAGTWALDCSKPASARLTVDTQSLRLSAGGKQLRTTARFDVALLGEGQPTGLSLLAMKDASGPYLTVDADAPLRKQFGDKALSGKFRPCP
jgi:hypothetical protein